MPEKFQKEKSHVAFTDITASQPLDSNEAQPGQVNGEGNESRKELFIDYNNQGSAGSEESTGTTSQTSSSGGKHFRSSVFKKSNSTGKNSSKRSSLREAFGSVMKAASFHSNAGSQSVSKSESKKLRKSERVPTQATKSDSGKMNRAKSRTSALMSPNVCATSFQIRSDIMPEQHLSLLSHMDAREEDSNESQGWVPGPMTQRVFNYYVLLSLCVIVLLLSTESSCELETQRVVASVVKVMHAISSVIYMIFSMFCHWAISRRDEDGDDLLQAKRAFTHSSTMTALKSKPRLPRFCKKPCSSKNGFWLDLISLGGLAAEVIHLGEEPSKEPSLSQWFVLLSLARVWRPLAKRDRTGHQTSSGREVIKLFLQLACLAHLSACGFSLLATLENRFGMPTWADASLTDPFGGPRSCTKLYNSALYFSTYTLTSIGYGDVVPANELEQFLLTLFMLVSQMYAAKIFADLNFITSTQNYWHAQHRARIMQTSAALTSMGVPKLLFRRVLAYQDFVDKLLIERRAQVHLDDLGPRLKEEIRLVVYHKLVIRAPFFSSQPVDVIRMIVMSLSDFVYLPCDFVVRYGEYAEELYFLRTGQCSVFACPEMPKWEEENCAMLHEGCYFGEVALLTGKPRTNWIMARTYCVCAVLPKTTLDMLNETHPGSFISLVQSMQQTLHIVPTTTWQKLSLRFAEDFVTTSDVFEWICESGGNEFCDELWVNDFMAAMTRLHVSAFDAKLLWVEMDKNAAGYVTYDEFCNMLDACADEEEMMVDVRQSGGSLPLDAIRESHTERGSVDNMPVAAVAPPNHLVRTTDPRANSTLTGSREFKGSKRTFSTAEEDSSTNASSNDHSPPYIIADPNHTGEPEKTDDKHPKEYLREDSFDANYVPQPKESVDLKRKGANSLLLKNDHERPHRKSSWRTSEVTNAAKSRTSEVTNSPAQGMLMAPQEEKRETSGFRRSFAAGGVRASTVGGHGPGGVRASTLTVQGPPGRQSTQESLTGAPVPPPRLSRNRTSNQYERTTPKGQNPQNVQNMLLEVLSGMADLQQAVQDQQYQLMTLSSRSIDTQIRASGKSSTDMESIMGNPQFNSSVRSIVEVPLRGPSIMLDTSAVSPSTSPTSRLHDSDDSLS